jgi:hypothetical protein
MANKMYALMSQREALMVAMESANQSYRDACVALADFDRQNPRVPICLPPTAHEYAASKKGKVTAKNLGAALQQRLKKEGLGDAFKMRKASKSDGMFILELRPNRAGK